MKNSIKILLAIYGMVSIQLIPSTFAGEELTQEPGGPYVPSDPRWAEIRRKDKEDPQWQGKTPISFYGRVLDQYDKPVQDVNVGFSWTDLSPQGSSTKATLSDTNGNFALLGVQGKNLIVKIRKDGYYESRVNQASFDYAAFWAKNYHVPDKSKPVIFRLWKKGEIEPLKVHQVLLNIMGNEIPLGFDPTCCKTNSNGPLMFNLFLDDTNNWQQADITLKITVKDGGIQMIEDEFPFLAPKNGYKSSIDIKLDKHASRNVADREIQFYFFLKTLNLYGRFKVEVPAFNKNGKVLLTLNYWLNPAGSRNLEYDPKKFIRIVPMYYLQSKTPSIDSMN